jgi:hypothetical protein
LAASEPPIYPVAPVTKTLTFASFVVWPNDLGSWHAGAAAINIQGAVENISSRLTAADEVERWGYMIKAADIKRR